MKVACALPWSGGTENTYRVSVIRNILLNGSRFQRLEATCRLYQSCISKFVLTIVFILQNDQILHISRVPHLCFVFKISQCVLYISHHMGHLYWRSSCLKCRQLPRFAIRLKDFVIYMGKNLKLSQFLGPDCTDR